MRVRPADVPGSVAIITHAHEKVGLGHAMRQLAIAEQARRAGSRIVVVSDTPLVADICRDRGIAHRSANSLDSRSIEPILRSEQPERLLIDVHESRVAELTDLGESWPSTFVVSEVGHRAPRVGEHVVLVGSGLERWKRTDRAAGGTLVHSGRAFIVFRDEFAATRSEARTGERVLVAHGGADPHRLTWRSMVALNGIDRRLDVDVLIGRAFRDVNQLVELAEGSHHLYHLHHGSDKTARLMGRATLGLINGGNVRYELCRTGTPFIALSFNASQWRCTEQIACLGAGVNLGIIDDLGDQSIASSVEELLDDPASRQGMERIMRDLFDMQGASRILRLGQRSRVAVRSTDV